MRTYDCPSCGQASIEDDRENERHLMIECHGKCPRCRAREIAPQGETVRLFEPAPTQLEGQGGLW